MNINVLENFLRLYVKLHLHTWSKHLNVAEFAVNNVINMSIGYTPFYLNAGEYPALPKNLLVSPRSTSNQAMQEAIGQMKEELDDTKLNLIKAQERMKTQVDKTR